MSEKAMNANILENQELLRNDLIKELRKNPISMVHAAEKIGINPATISKFLKSVDIEFVPLLKIARWVEDQQSSSCKCSCKNSKHPTDN